MSEIFSIISLEGLFFRINIYITTPILHKSHFSIYSPLLISGAIKTGLPALVDNFCLRLINFLLIP